MYRTNSNKCSHKNESILDNLIIFRIVSHSNLQTESYEVFILILTKWFHLFFTELIPHRVNFETYQYFAYHMVDR